MNRAAIATAVKLAIAAAIVWFLIATDRLSLGPVRRLFDSPGICIALVALQLVIMLLGVVRWWVILRAIEGRARPLVSLLAYTWVGLFFGCVLPSAVATDFVRYRYLRQGEAVPAPLLTSILVDRICGVTSLGLLALVFSPRMLSRMASGSRMWTIGLILVGVIAAVTLLSRSQHPAIREQFDRVSTAMRSTFADKTTSLIAVVLGFVAHGLKCLSLWLMVCAVSSADLSLGGFFSFAPVGFIVEALPLAPGGVGTAHLMFEHLFLLFGVAGGASLFNAYFLTRMVVNLGGGVIWLFTRPR